MDITNTGWQQADPSVSFEEWQDNWIRTFQQDKIPNLQENEKAMLDGFLENNELTKIVIYFQKYKNMDDEMCEFMLRELMRGNL